MKIEVKEFGILGCGLNTRDAGNNDKLVEIAHQRLNDWLSEQEYTITPINIESIYVASDRAMGSSPSLFKGLRFWFTTNR